MFRSAIILSCLLFGFCQANPHQVYQSMPQATERQGFGANAGFQLGAGAPNGLQNNNLLMTVIVGLGVISALQIVTNIVAPLLKKKDDKAKTDKKDSTDKKDTAAKARSLPEMLSMAENVLSAIESLGQEFNSKRK